MIGAIAILGLLGAGIAADWGFIRGLAKGKTIILVDDVIYSGRTIRAALDSLHDFGRPEQVLLAVLIDRGDRRLPITPNFTGRTVNIDQEERIQVSALDDLKGFEVYINAA